MTGHRSTRRRVGPRAPRAFVAIDWTCCGHRLGRTEIADDGDGPADVVFTLVDGYSRLVDEHEGMAKLNMTCDRCARTDVVLGGAEALRQLLRLRALRDSGGSPNVVRLDVALLGAQRRTM